MKFPEVDSTDKKQLESIKNYLADERVKELIEKSNDTTNDKIILDKLPYDLKKLGDILQLLEILPKLTEEQKIVVKTELLNQPSLCDNCQLTPNECLLNRKRAREVLTGNKDEIIEIWNQERSFRSCLSFILIEMF